MQALFASVHVPASRVAFSEELSARAWACFIKDPPQDLRLRFCISAILLAHEHHSSVVNLVNGRRFASATTLLRPLLEAVVTSAWGTYAADLRRVEAVMAAHARLPDLRKMIQSVEKRPELAGRTGFGAMMRDHGSIFHSFTHGEVEQLKRRFGVGPMASTYSLRENYGTLMIADTLLLASLGLYATLSRSLEVETFVSSSFEHMFSNARRDFPEFSLPEWKRWEPLPAPTPA